jgi:GTP cyclohydrolase I
MKLMLRMFGGKITRVSINICTTMENKREEACTHEETVLLIERWGDQRVQEQLENTPKRNLEIFKRICQDIKDRLPDFSRSAQDCRARIKRLKTKYFQSRRENNKSRGKRKMFPITTD